MLTIKQAAPEDIPVLRAVAFQIWREYYPAILSREQIDYMLEWMYSPAVIQNELGAGVVWELALLEAQTAGFISYAHQKDRAEVKLNKIYLLPSMHGQGLGRQLLAHVKGRAEALGARRICLQVNKRNQRAIRAYERAGFRVSESIVSNIGCGFVMDDYVMTLDLPGTSLHESGNKATVSPLS